ncbi:MAG: hypothetical protein R3B35_12400 [Gemmatimonadales bacterium]
MLLVPMGYQAKRVIDRPASLAADWIDDLYSVSGCLSRAVIDARWSWLRNGFHLLDTPSQLLDIAHAFGISVAGARLFYYATHPFAFDETVDGWRACRPASAHTRVAVPVRRTLEGFDLVTYDPATGVGCSPLSCNGLAATTGTNRHCLLPSLRSAISLLEQGFLANTEPGPYRVVAVYSVPWPGTTRTPAAPANEIE